jgi:hypothetical protein
VTPEIRQFGDEIVAIWPGQAIVMQFSRIHEHKDTLSAELTVSNEVRCLGWWRVNLASASGRHAVIKALEDSGESLPWRAMLDRACQLVARHLRTSEPAVAMVPTRPTAEQFLVTPWIPLNGITVLYGPGGSAKSLLALWLALAGVLGHTLGGPWPVGKVKRVLYLDWEANKETHEGRIWGLTRVFEPPAPDAFLYRRLRRPLLDVIADIRTEAERKEVDLTILDSLAPASGPDPETAGAAVPTLQALDSLPGTKLCLAHVSKAGAEQQQAKPFGSIMVENLARSTIEIRRQEGTEANETVVSLYHRKTNGPLATRAEGVRILFDPEDGGIILTRHEPETGNDSLTARILNAMRGGEKSVTGIAEDVGSTPASVRGVLNRLEKRDRVLRIVTHSPGRGRETEWGLVDRKRDTS